jgi:hypothetical protein
MPPYREPQWDEERTSRSSFHFASDPAVPASGSPLDLLPTVDRLIYLGRAFRIPMADVAKAFGMSRETVYVHLRRARANLETVAPPAEAQPGKRCACGELRPAGRRRCEACWRERTRARAAAEDAGVGGEGA